MRSATKQLARSGVETAANPRRAWCDVNQTLPSRVPNRLRQVRRDGATGKREAADAVPLAAMVTERGVDVGSKEENVGEDVEPADEKGNKAEEGTVAIHPTDHPEIDRKDLQ